MRKRCDCVLWNQSGELVSREIKYLSQRIGNLERCISWPWNRGCICKNWLLKENPYLCCGTGCRVIPNQYKIRCVLSFYCYLLYYCISVWICDHICVWILHIIKINQKEFVNFYKHYSPPSSVYSSLKILNPHPFSFGIRALVFKVFIIWILKSLNGNFMIKLLTLVSYRYATESSWSCYFEKSLGTLKYYIILQVKVVFDDSWWKDARCSFKIKKEHWFWIMDSQEIWLKV